MKGTPLNQPITRREAIRRSALLAALIQTGFISEGKAENKIRIGACDWSIGKSSDPAAFDVAKAIGLEGIQVNLGNMGNNLHVREKSMQELYLQESKRTGVAIASLAIAEMNNVPYKSESVTEQWAWESIDVAKAFNVNVILLAFFYKNDLRNDDAGKKEVIRRLKIAAPKAEKLGITLGIESYLSAEEHVDIIEKVGSKSVKVYYDFRNSADAGYDVIREIRWLGKDRICELHMKENGYLLGEGSLDWLRICETLKDIGYEEGWMQIEGANPKGANVMESYRHNLEFLKKCFHY